MEYSYEFLAAYPAFQEALSPTDKIMADAWFEVWKTAISRHYQPMTQDAALHHVYEVARQVIYYKNDSTLHKAALYDLENAVWKVGRQI